jgi:hypothetical protein
VVLLVMRLLAGTSLQQCPRSSPPTLTTVASAGAFPLSEWCRRDHGDRV